MLLRHWVSGLALANEQMLSVGVLWKGSTARSRWPVRAKISVALPPLNSFNIKSRLLPIGAGRDNWYPFTAVLTHFIHRSLHSCSLILVAFHMTLLQVINNLAGNCSPWTTVSHTFTQIRAINAFREFWHPSIHTENWDNLKRKRKREEIFLKIQNWEQNIAI